ncbi:flagellar basal body rod protein FlgC [Bacillus sp. EB01]|uniref:flagellar basal body rod protein FlgC n=1 Tax=Bacillus sp. EB01 TaxID=1347086 RepID=UPI0009DE8388|nr:flagellar basal body rod protein FlgC [Bacillus sp. EB01]
MFDSLNINASALTAQRLRMDVVSSNIANANSTRGRFVNGEWEPYRRKMVEMESRQSQFAGIFQTEMSKQAGQGVRVTRIAEDQTPFKLVFDPSHPDANPEGYVRLPNVDLSREMIDLMASSRSYEANVTAFNTGKSLMLKALELGR